MNCILALFNVTKNCNKKNKWNQVTSADLLKYFETEDTLKQFFDVELRAIVRYLRKSKGFVIKESSPKAVKVHELAVNLKLKLSINTEVKPKYARKPVQTLAEIALKVITKNFSKHELSVIQAEYLWPDRYQEWISEIGATQVNGQFYNWFYKPEYSLRRKQFEVRCVDSTHLMTRTRRKSCKGGLEGLSNGSWMKVAKSGKTLLTPIMIEETTDSMSIKMATTHFSEAVESMMERNGDLKAASFCRDIRQWWEAEDTPGISATERLGLREGL